MHLTNQPTRWDNDKNTVIALREIAEEKIKVPDLTESAVYKLRKHVEQIDDGGGMTRKERDSARNKKTQADKKSAKSSMRDEFIKKHGRKPNKKEAIQMTAVDAPLLASAIPRFAVKVVLPTPPLPEQINMVRLFPTRNLE